MLDEKIRDRFPMLINKVQMQGHPLVYLDNAATTLKPATLLENIRGYYSVYTASLMRGDYDLAHKVDSAALATRKAVAAFINAKKETEIIYCSGATEAINIVANGYGISHLKPGHNIVLSVVEHSANVLPWFHVRRVTGCEIRFAGMDAQGNIDMDDLERKIDNNTKIVSLAHVSNVMGQVLDAKLAAQKAHAVGAIFVLDGAQSVPHMPVDVQDLDCDFLAFSAHKMCGPTGLGILYGKYDLLKITDPLLTGGGMNITYNREGEVRYLNPPMKFEGGTPNAAGIIALKAALDLMNEIGMDRVNSHELKLHDYAIKKLKKVPNIVIYNETARSGIITFNVKGVFAQDLATLLNSNGIAVRSGQHCARILSEFLGVNSTVRASLYLYNTKEDVDRLVDTLMHAEDFLDAYF